MTNGVKSTIDTVQNLFDIGELQAIQLDYSSAMLGSLNKHMYIVGTACTGTS